MLIRTAAANINQRLGKHLAERFVLDFEFIEVSSPV